jgi:hypothetical protein
MPRKMTRSAPRTPSELPKVLVTVGTARRIAGRSEKGQYSCLLGIHLGNPGVDDHGECRPKRHHRG